MIYENLQLKKENANLENKITDLIKLLESKMTLMVDVLNQINDKPSNVTQVVNSIRPRESNDNLVTVKKDTPMFIPSPDSSHLKLNAQELKKTKKNIDLDSSLDKLSKL